MTEFFYKAFQDAPYACYWLPAEGELWYNTAAKQLDKPGTEIDAVQRLLTAALKGPMAPQLTDALRVGGFTLMPLPDGVFATQAGGGLAPMQNFSTSIREPLTNIYAVLPLLAKKLEDADLAYAEEIQSNCYTLLRLASNLETTGRLGAKPTQAHPVDLSSLVDSLCVCARSVCRERGVEILRRLPGEPLVVLGDTKLLGEAILNLLRNSLQYTREGNQITVKLFRAGNRAVLNVEDRGIGIQPDNVEHIFEPYFSADPYGDSPIRPGLGLGLSITSGVVTSFGGSLAAESRFGEGTRITLALPLANDTPGAPVLESDPADYLLNRYSTIYVQLSGLCRLPVV